jgi:hypothetical protein
MAYGEGDSGDVTVNIHIQTGVAQTVRAEMLNLAPQLAEFARAGVIDAKRRNKMRDFR